MKNKKKPIVLAVIMAFTLQSCATNTGITVIDKTSNAMKETFNSDDPCSKSKRNVGIAAGAIIGAIIGNLAGGKNKTLTTGGGLILGATVLGLIGNELGKRECELSKVAKQNGLQLETTEIKSKVEVAQKNNPKLTETKEVDVGLSVSVVDQESKPQFLTGSDKLQTYAEQHFQEIAKLYTVEHALKSAETQKPEEIEALKKAMASKRILLIGHTDDTGDTNFNAKLSENRARTVAQIFEKAGISSSQIYYQGAGETMPLADNETEQGRAKNRRVEIVDLTDEDSFDLYLQNKRPNTQYYRPVIAKKEKKSPIIETKPKEEVKVTKKEEKSEVKQETKVVKKAQTQTKSKPNLAGFIDFGGKPLSSMKYVADIGNLKQQTSNFSLITEARASDISKIATCELDRPRNTGLVKTLKDDKEYSTNDFKTGLFNNSWSGYANNHLIALSNVAVLKDSATPAHKPKFMIYREYITQGNKLSKPDFITEPDVNVYQGEKALLFRVFNNGPIKCMDLVVPNENPWTSPQSLIIYEKDNDYFGRVFKLDTTKNY